MNKRLQGDREGGRKGDRPERRRFERWESRTLRGIKSLFVTGSVMKILRPPKFPGSLNGELGKVRAALYPPSSPFDPPLFSVFHSERSAPAAVRAGHRVGDSPGRSLEYQSSDLIRRLMTMRAIEVFRTTSNDKFSE